ncbi:MAG: cupredoxin domain-containing protein [Clostridia bacterium]|nr:cupredoxin domain-containing protein [Deltaproteobacteria bacterium]
MKRSAFAVIALLISLVALHAYATTPREIEVIVDGGYKPAKIDIAPGEAVRLKFTRKEYTPCTKDVVFPTLNITRELPVNQPVIIDIPPQQSGEVPFRCGMNMVRGTLVVKAE